MLNMSRPNLPATMSKCALIGILLTCLSVGVCWAEDPIQKYKDAKIFVEAAESLFKAQEYDKALKKYREAELAFNKIQEQYPDWSSSILVDIQLRRTKDKITAILTRDKKMALAQAVSLEPQTMIEPAMPELAPAAPAPIVEPQRPEPASLPSPLFHKPALSEETKKEIDELGEKGNQFLAEREYGLALGVYDQALKLGDDPQISLNKAIALFKLNRVAESITIIKQLVQQDPSFAAAQYNLADIYYSLGELDSAASEYKRAVALDPEDLRSRTNLGVILVRLGFYNQALEQFLVIIKQDEEATEAHYNLGVIYSDYLFDKDKAIFHYSKYLDLNPGADDRLEVEQWIKELRSME